MSTDVVMTESELEAPPPAIAPPSSKSKEKPPEKPDNKTEVKTDDGKRPVGRPPKGKEEEVVDPGSVWMTPTLRKLRDHQQMETAEWLNALAGEASIKVAVIRKEPDRFTDPVTGEKVKVDGQVAVYDRQVSEEEIQKRHGGGLYQFSVQIKNDRGRWQFFGSKTVNIAGDPILDDVPRVVRPTATPTVIQQGDPSSGKAMDTVIGLLGRQLEQPRAPQGPSMIEITQIIAQATAPLQAQITALLSQLTQKDAELARAREAPQDPFQQKLLLGLMDGESARIAALRTQHESELRMLKQAATDLENRLRDQFQRDLDSAEKRHDREIASLKEAQRNALEMAKHSSETNKTILESENKRLSAELADTKSELKDLQKLRNPSFKDKIDEVNALKELVSDGDEEEKGTAAQLVEVLGNVPAISKLIDRIGGPGEQPQQQQQQQAPQRPKLIKAANGDVFQRTAQGLVPVKKKNQEVLTEGGGKVEIPPIDPEQVKQAVQFMEAAFKNGTAPDTFAQTARPYVGSSMIQAIRVLGVSDFLSKIAKLEATSPLATQGGRNWSKKVAAALVGSADEEPSPTPEVEA